MNFEADSSLI